MKILYNVTIIIDHAVHHEWKEWMLDVHIPDVMETKCMESYMMNKILDGKNPDGVTYAIQYLIPDMDTFKRYQKDFAPALQDAHNKRYKGKYGAYRTVMEVVDCSMCDEN